MAFAAGTTRAAGEVNHLEWARGQLLLPQNSGSRRGTGTTMGIQRLYTNAVTGKHALDFFKEHAPGCVQAQLVCPFFTWTEPLRILKRAGVKDIQLLVRLCYATLPEALKEAECIPGV